MNIKGVAAGVAAVSMLFTVPAQAGGMSQAEKLRRLDIMLMVTGLRCRTGADNFQADYRRFTTNHIAELNAASATLKADLAKRYGAAGATRALDKLSVTMANDYGNGHPWLGCGQLKKVASGLAAAKGSAPLVEAADQLLGDGAGGGQMTWARR
ncbi:MAG: S-adenosyl-L-homocysteine hydrolase [Sphingomonadales bacterium]|nr:S-adenosyl-L-homocysteine hydrolase [Sphingomonadales bacterium]